MKNEQGVILYASSADGRAFTTPVRIPTLGGPKASHPQIAISGSGRIFVAWDEVRGGVRRAAIAPLDGSTPAQMIGDATSYPVMAASPAGLIAAWTAGTAGRSTIGVRIIE